MAWLRRAVRWPGREREAVVQAAKMTVAALAAWAIARHVLRMPEPFMAPYAAVFMVNDTVYRSLATAARQVAALITGQLLAFVTIIVVRQVDAALAVAVFAGMLLGSWRRLGDSGYWIGVTALLMLTYGTADNGDYLVQRLALGALGAAIGVVVNVVVLPPVHLRQGRRAVDDLSDEIRRLASELAEGLRHEWSADQARTWVHRARALEDAVRAAERALSRSRESVRLNPLRAVRRQRYGTVDCRPVLGRLHEVSEQLLRSCEVLERLPASAEAGEPRPDAAFLSLFADMLASVAAAVAALPAGLSERTAERVAGDLTRIRDYRHRLTTGVRAGATPLPHSWSTQGSLILAAEHALDALST